MLHDLLEVVVNFMLLFRCVYISYDTLILRISFIRSFIEHRTVKMYKNLLEKMRLAATTILNIFSYLTNCL
jgi:hypothetical protein